jgi:hypothetical protein
MQPFNELKSLLERREKRIEQRVPVRVWGMDNQKKAFVQPTTTLDVSSMGARIDNLNRWSEPGETIGIGCGPEKARYKIVWVGTEGQRVGQVGVKCLERGKITWNPDAKPKVAMTRQERENERRRQARYDVLGGIHLRQPDKNVAIFGKLTQISMGGCFFRTANPIAVGTPVTFEAGANFLQFSATGKILSVYGDGMSLVFDEIRPDQLEGLKLLIIGLEESNRFHLAEGTA